MTYGTRTCLQCGKSFIAAYPAQITCSLTCRKARIKELDRKWHLLHGKASKPDDLDWANGQLEAALVKIKGLEQAADALKKETATCQNASKMAEELLKEAKKFMPPPKTESEALPEPAKTAPVEKIERTSPKIRHEKSKQPSKADKQAAKKAAAEAAKKATEEKEDREAAAKTAKDKKPRYRHICKNCGRVFYSPFQESSYCDDQCLSEALSMGVIL